MAKAKAKERAWTTCQMPTWNGGHCQYKNYTSGKYCQNCENNMARWAKAESWRYERRCNNLNLYNSRMKLVTPSANKEKANANRRSNNKAKQVNGTAAARSAAS